VKYDWILENLFARKHITSVAGSPKPRLLRRALMKAGFKTMIHRGQFDIDEVDITLEEESLDVLIVPDIPGSYCNRHWEFVKLRKLADYYNAAIVILVEGLGPCFSGHCKRSGDNFVFTIPDQHGYGITEQILELEIK